MRKMMIMFGVVALAGVIGVGEADARNLNTNTATVNSNEMGLLLNAGSKKDFKNYEQLIAHFAQDGNMSLKKNGKKGDTGYNPTGAPGAMTSNPDGCVITDLNNLDTGLMGKKAKKNNCGHRSWDPQTAPTALLQNGNTASTVIRQDISFSMITGESDSLRTVGGKKTFDHMDIDGGVNFEMVPNKKGGTITVMETGFTQELDEYTKLGRVGGSDEYLAGNSTFIYDASLSAPIAATNNKATANWNDSHKGIELSQGFVQNIQMENTVAVPVTNSEFICCDAPPSMTSLPVFEVDKGETFAIDAHLVPVLCSDGVSVCGEKAVLDSPIAQFASGNATTNDGIVNVAPPGFDKVKK